jgi:hypothetical protein
MAELGDGEFGHNGDCSNKVNNEVGLLPTGEAGELNELEENAADAWGLTPPCNPRGGIRLDGAAFGGSLEAV